MLAWPSFSYVVAENRYLATVESCILIMVHVLFDLLLWVDAYSSLATFCSKSLIISDRFGSLGLKSA